MTGSKYIDVTDHNLRHNFELSQFEYYTFVKIVKLEIAGIGCHKLHNIIVVKAKSQLTPLF